MLPMKWAHFKGTVVPLEDAKISIASHSLQYGSTCFAGMRGHMREGSVRLFRVKEHHARLMRAMQIMGWSFSISLESFTQAIRDLISVNQPEGEFYIRPFVFSDTEALKMDYRPLKFHLGIYMVPFGALFDPSRGLNVKVSPWKKIADDTIPTKAKAGGAYLNSCLATTDALTSGFDEALMTNHEGHVVEASAANLLIRRGNTLIVPPMAGILEGITLLSALEILKDEGMEVETQTIDLSMLRSADEVLVLGTAAQVSFVESVDGRLIQEGPGPICQLLRQRMEEIISLKDPKFKEWISTIKVKEKIPC